MPDALLDIPAVAAYLHVRERWVRRQIAERRIPFIKVGALVRFEPDAIERYKRERSVDARESS